MPTQTVTVQSCHKCHQTIQTDQIECSCGAINLASLRRRKIQNRPQREHLREILSEGKNGKYIIFKNGDQSVSCTCLSFLFQRGVETETQGIATCKHIRKYLEDNTLSYPTLQIEKPSDWQRVSLKKMGVEGVDHLTDDQSYFIFHDLLEKQGVTYKEYETLLMEFGNVNLLPIYPFGIEFEGLIQNASGPGIERLNSAMNAEGISCVTPGYTHETMNDWKIVSDGSIRPEGGYQTLELVTPKLFGAKGFREVQKVLKLWNQIGGKVNASAGTHVHIDAWNLELLQMIELTKVWIRIEQEILWYLVSPSRRNGRYEKRVDRAYLSTLVVHGPNVLDRYHSLNLNAFVRHKTIEFRLHNGTLDEKKIIPWVIFLLKLVDSVKRGLTSRDIEELSIENVLDKIGMNLTSTSLLKNARESLIARYQYWKEDEITHPEHRPEIISIDLDGAVEGAMENRIRELFTYNRRTLFSNPDPGSAANSILNLSRTRPSRSIPFDSIRQVLVEPSPWRLPPINSGEANEGPLITLMSETDTLTCSCRRFRSHLSCFHSINAAQLILISRNNNPNNNQIENVAPRIGNQTRWEIGVARREEGGEA